MHNRDLIHRALNPDDLPIYSVCRVYPFLQLGPSIGICVTTTLSYRYMHNRDLIHRALNPENVVIDASGYVKVVDFQQVPLPE